MKNQSIKDLVKVLEEGKNTKKDQKKLLLAGLAVLDDLLDNLYQIRRAIEDHA